MILGTLPGPESLRLEQYYAHTNNQFWRIIYTVFGESDTDASYEEKKVFLLDHRIALWDIFHTAVRKGALDSEIKFEEPNDIPGLIREFPRINRILLAGKKAEKSFSKYFPGILHDVAYVPSTSPAYAKKPFDEKVIDWKKALFS